MPPKTKTSREMVINGAMKIVRERGVEALNVRFLAKQLNCSTQPIFSRYKNTDELKSDLIKTAYELYFSYITEDMQKGKYPPYKAMGMSYIRFAIEEKNLFKLLFMSSRKDKESSVAQDWQIAVNCIKNNLGVSEAVANKIHFQMWCFVHGIAVMQATEFNELSLEEISESITDIYNGLKANYGVKV